MLYNTSTYRRVRDALDKGGQFTLTPDTMDILDFNAVGYAMLDHVTKLRSN